MKLQLTDKIVDYFQIKDYHFQKMAIFQKPTGFPQWLEEIRSNWDHLKGSFWNDGYDDYTGEYQGHIEYKHNNQHYYVKPDDYIVLLHDRIMPVSKEIFELFFIKIEEKTEE